MNFSLPELGEGVYEAELLRWLVKEGDRVTPGQNLLEALTDKATMEVPAPFAGTIGKLLAKEGDKIKVGHVMLAYSGAGDAAPSKVAASPERVERKAPRSATAATGNGAVAAVKAAPSVRLLARKLGVDLAGVRGSGPGGRVLVEDLVGQGTSPAKPQAAMVVDYGKPGTRIKLAGLRRAIAEHMVAAKRVIPHYTYVDECDVSDLVKTRDGLREVYGKQNLKITFMPFLIKAAVQALKSVPLVNASLDDAAGEIVLHDKYHIGFAAATPGGLVVPVIKDADRLSLVDLARAIERLSEAVRASKAKREDLMGGTFTITSIGNIGGLFATPIIHLPQVGIVGVGKIVKRPVFDAHGQVRAADMVYLSFSFDHRVVDGAIGAAFGNALIERLKNPAALLVE